MLLDPGITLVQVVGHQLCLCGLVRCPSKQLREEVCAVRLSRYLDDFSDPLVPQHLDPILPEVDVLHPASSSWTLYLTYCSCSIDS